MTRKLGVLVVGVVAVLAVAGCQASVGGSSPVVSSTVTSSGESSAENGATTENDGDCTFEAGSADSDDGRRGGDNIGNEGNCSSFGEDNGNGNGFGNGYGSGQRITIR